MVGQLCGHFRVPTPSRILCPPPPISVLDFTQGQKSSLTLVLSGTAHIVRHPTHRTEESSQVSAGHLKAHKVLQVGASRQWSLGRAGL